jgi:hypothetical protein
MDIQDLFYWMAVIYMSIMFVVMIAGVIAVFAIKRKVDNLHHIIDEKLQAISTIAHVGSELVSKAKSTFKSKKPAA